MIPTNTSTLSTHSITNRITEQIAPDFENGDKTTKDQLASLEKEVRKELFESLSFNCNAANYFGTRKSTSIRDYATLKVILEKLRTGSEEEKFRAYRYMDIIAGHLNGQYSTPSMQIARYSTKQLALELISKSQERSNVTDHNTPSLSSSFQSELRKCSTVDIWMLFYLGKPNLTTQQWYLVKEEYANRGLEESNTLNKKALAIIREFLGIQQFSFMNERIEQRDSRQTQSLNDNRLIEDMMAPERETLSRQPQRRLAPTNQGQQGMSYGPVSLQPNPTVRGNDNNSDLEPCILQLPPGSQVRLDCRDVPLDMLIRSMSNGQLEEYAKTRPFNSVQLDIQSLSNDYSRKTIVTYNYTVTENGPQMELLGTRQWALPPHMRQMLNLRPISLRMNLPGTTIRNLQSVTQRTEQTNNHNTNQSTVTNRSTLISESNNLNQMNSMTQQNLTQQSSQNQPTFYIFLP